MGYQWDFRWVYQYREVLLIGLWWTIKLNLVVLALGSMMGLVVAGGRLSKHLRTVLACHGLRRGFSCVPRSGASDLAELRGSGGDWAPVRCLRQRPWLRFP